MINDLGFQYEKNALEVVFPRSSNGLPYLKVPLTSRVAAETLVHSKKRYWAMFSDAGYYLD
jgi:hypothetical protein